MGCERVREASNVGVGGVRASMERRWLMNAKTTVMRQRKWEEVRIQKELEEQRKKVEILEKRKQERARLSAYIHSTVQQPPMKGATNPKLQRNDQKRSNWNMCLLQDQELILKLRENAKVVAHNNYSKRGCSNHELVLQGHYPDSRKDSHDPSVPMQVSVSSRSKAPNTCLERDMRDLDPLLEGPIRCTEVVALKSSLNRENQSSCPLLQVPVSCPPNCEIAVDTTSTWAPTNMMTCEVKFSDNHCSQRTRKLSSCSVHTTKDEANESQNGSTMVLNLKNVGAQIVTELTGYSPQVNSKKEFSSFDKALLGQESSRRTSDFDLREEILRSRLENEAATARLIAEVTAIESRLEDCNLSLKSLDFKEAEEECFATTGLTSTLDVDVVPVHIAVGANLDCGPSLVSDKRHIKEMRSRGADLPNIRRDQTKSNCEEQQAGQHNTRVSSLSGEVSDGTDLHKAMLGPCQSNNEEKFRCNGGGKIHMEGIQTFLQAQRNRAAGLCSLPSSTPKLFNENVGSTQAIGSPRPYDKAQRESLYIPLKITSNASDVVEHNALSEVHIVERRASWEIDWDAPTDPMPEIKEEYTLRMQVGCSCMSGMIIKTCCDKQGSHHRQVPRNVDESRLKVCEKIPGFSKPARSIPQGLIRQGGFDTHLSRMESSALPCHHLDFEASQVVQECSMHSRSPKDGYLNLDQDTFQETNSIQFARPRGAQLPQNSHSYENLASCNIHSGRDEKNLRKIHGLSLTEEEQKIFASLERLDWKLAAIGTRSVNVGRESMVSQGQYSTKSAPAVMGPPPKIIMEHPSKMSTKRAIPYSTLPPRPLTPQGPQTQRMHTGRRRRLVGLTNKAGKSHNLYPKT